MKCRHCLQQLTLPLVDLGTMPPSNAYLSSVQQFTHEVAYPLKVWVCQQCWLVQTEDFTKADELFTEDYAYFSSTSTSWLEHAKSYTQEVILHRHLDSNSFVVEIASNDGYLLRNFVASGISCLGVEPTRATAEAARALGIDVVSEFFGVTLAQQLKLQYGTADLIIANNVLAHVPDINDFVVAIADLMAVEGVCSFEFPHLLNLLRYHQFDTIYHEHYSYLSLHSVRSVVQKAGLRIWKVETLPTHGGSLRVWVCKEHSILEQESTVNHMLQCEIEFGLTNASVYQDFQAHVDKISLSLQQFFQQAKKQNKRVVAYGAAAKGNTLLNYAGITIEDLPVVFDAAKSKQGKFLPGSHIPILPPEQLTLYLPDYVLILPWNIRDEIQQQLAGQLSKQCKFVTLIPELVIT
ncbi:MAG: class I SAM-dependent methyltransferase [Gammaproteobacteria bacterium]|jgi:SAM-dependent methyltransferase|nr:class I SAM-dependent methyltransferase [Gammaproteobacteria bacterium]MBU2181060.1 class I SAM-dependent methyltransferase [Gammaproteobacteria bacterium]MBU2225790.1 class I SAM-dependent methyltransferase [Gammaproteobacteria bacterium]